MRGRTGWLALAVLFVSVSCDSGSGSNSAGPPGTYWSSLTVPDPGCIDVEEVPICGPSHVDRIELIEESTTEILGQCSFAGGDTAETQDLAEGYKFWCVRSPAAGGGTEITLYSNQANLLGIRAYLVRSSDGLPMWESYIPPADVLHGPGGMMLADPYEQTDLEFAGYKQLIFTTEEDKDYDFARQEALVPIQEAGYEAVLDRFEGKSPGFVAYVNVYDTLDGRALMVKRILEKRGWKVQPGETRGNVGTLEYRERYSVTAMPLIVTDIVTTGEDEVSGSVMVLRNGEEVTDARVTVNGAELSHWSGGLYQVGDAGLQGLGPGSSLTIEVTPKGAETPLTLTFSCPPAIEFSSPEPNQLIAPNQDLEVTWSPGIPYDAMRIAGGPMLGIFACYLEESGPLVSSKGHGADFISLEVGQTSQSLPVGECRRYLLELQYPGEQVIQEEEGDELMGYCSVRHRLWLQGPE